MVEPSSLMSGRLLQPPMPAAPVVLMLTIEVTPVFMSLRKMSCCWPLPSGLTRFVPWEVKTT